MTGRGSGRATGRVEAWVVTAPGLESITATELARLDIRVARTGRGGLSCAATPAQLVNANLRLRTATRVQVRTGRFRASGERDLSRGLREIDWSPYLTDGRAVRLNVSSSGSRLYHTGLIAEVAASVFAEGGHRVVTGGAVSRVASDINTGTDTNINTDRAVGAHGRDDAEGSPESDASTVSIRLAHDTVTVSIDSSGEPLFRRGARTAVGEAPMRETVAAALVAWSGWDGKGLLRDPCCGAGTIVIEAAQWAMRIAPGSRREFALEHWPSIDAELVAKLRRAADADRRPGRGLRIEASDIDTAVLDAARANAERAEVADRIVFTQRDVRQKPAVAADLVVANPPYGVRSRADLPAVYRAVSDDAPRSVLVVPDHDGVDRWIGRSAGRRLEVENGGLAVCFRDSAT